MVAAGDLIERIQFRYKSEEYDPAEGKTVTTWNTRAEVWAKLEYLSGEERVLYGVTDKAYRDYAITIRARDDIQQSDTIVWRGAALAIRAVRRESGRDAFLTIEAEYGAGDSGALER